MNLRPAECTTCAVALGVMSKKREKSLIFVLLCKLYGMLHDVC